MERAAAIVENSDPFSQETKTSYDLVKYKTKLKSLNKIRVTSSLHKGDSKYERAQLGGGVRWLASGPQPDMPECELSMSWSCEEGLVVEQC